LYAYDRVGKTLVKHHITNFEGSPYLTPGWVKGAVKLSDGVTVKDLDLKYNVKDDKIFFKGNSGEVMEFVKSVNEFVLDLRDAQGNFSSVRYKKGYTNIAKISPEAYLEVLTDGKAQLLKRTVRSVLSSREFTTPVKTETMVENTRFYLVLEGKASEVKNEKKSILKILADKKDEIENYINANNLTFSSYIDLIIVVEHYNSLQSASNIN